MKKNPHLWSIEEVVRLNEFDVAICDVIDRYRTLLPLEFEPKKTKKKNVGWAKEVNESDLVKVSKGKIPILVLGFSR